MDAAIFIASKTLGRLAQVESWVVILLLLSLWATWRGRRGRALWTGGGALAFLLALALFPLGNPGLAALESRYPANPLLGKVDGIIVLGGSEDLAAFAHWGGFETNEAGERLVAAALLAKRFPQARLIYSGGTANLLDNPNHDLPSHMALQFFADMGITADRIVVEDRSRNTAENAVLTKTLAQPQPGQVYLLVTSAWHMPRAMQAFDRAGWQGIVAWPVDFRSARNTWRAGWRLDAHLVELNLVVKEYLGLAVYALAGKA